MALNNFTQPPRRFGLSYTVAFLASPPPGGDPFLAAGLDDPSSHTYHIVINGRALLHAARNMTISLGLLIALLAGRRQIRGLMMQAGALLLMTGVLAGAGARFVWCEAGPRLAAADRRRVRARVAAGARVVVAGFAAAAVVFAAFAVLVWSLRRVVGAVLWFGGGDVAVSSEGLTMAEYDDMVRAAKNTCERPVADWTWARGYVQRPCLFPRCVLPNDD